MKFARVIHAGLFLLGVVGTGCSGEEESGSRIIVPAVEQPDLPSGAKVTGRATVGPQGGTVVASEAEGVYAGAEVRFPPNTFAEDATVDLVELSSMEWGELPVPVLLVRADRRPATVQIEVVMDRPAELAGLPGEALTLFGLVPGSPRWLPIVEGSGPVAESLGSLSRGLGTAELPQTAASLHGFIATRIDEARLWVEGRAEVGDDGSGERVDVDNADFAQAVQFGARGFTTSELFEQGQAQLMAGFAGFAVADKSYRILAVNQPAHFAAPTGQTLREWFCGEGRSALLVHGLLSHFKAFDGAGDVTLGLTSRGWHVAKYAYPSARSIRANGERLAAWLDDGASACRELGLPARTSVAVGHSMGGLVLRRAVQDGGADEHLERVVMLATPNGGGDHTRLAEFIIEWVAEGLVELVAAELGIPPDIARELSPDADFVLRILELDGIADLLVSSPTLDPDVADSVNNRAKVAQHADSYFVVTGWSALFGFEATDGLVELDSALSLDLPAGHEWYFSRDADGEITAKQAQDRGDGWQGESDDDLGHSPIHTKAASTGVLDLVDQLLSDGAPPVCSPDCEDRACGDDGCGGTCGRCGRAEECVDGACVGDAPPGEVNVTFQVDMRNEDVEVGCPVHVAGTFNEWSLDATPLADEDGDGVWSVTLPFEPGAAIEYRFLNCDRDGWESVPEEGECAVVNGRYVNRALTVPDANTTLDAICFGSCDLCAGVERPVECDPVCPDGAECVDGECVGIQRPQGEFVLIQPGEFVMGSPPDELGRDNDEAQHRVRLTRAFWLGTTEVTQGEWAGLMGNNPSRFSDCGDDCPVETVNWYAALAYANALSRAEGLAECYVLGDCNGRAPGEDMECETADFAGLDCAGYRLPTEAEWEYAARAGTQTAFHTGAITQTRCNPLDPNLDRAGWYCGNSGGTTHAVAGKQPNAWGLYDMHGNVWEWVQDRYGGYPNDALTTDPIGPAGGGDRVRRGGSWNRYAPYARAASRSGSGPGNRDSDLGFRLARSNP